MGSKCHPICSGLGRSPVVENTTTCERFLPGKFYRQKNLVAKDYRLQRARHDWSITQLHALIRERRSNIKLTCRRGGNMQMGDELQRCRQGMVEAIRSQRGQEDVLSGRASTGKTALTEPLILDAWPKQWE